jgi:hypothetical protein
MTKNKIAPEIATHMIHTKRAMFIGFWIHSLPIFMSKVQSILRAKTPLMRSRRPWLLEDVTEREKPSLSCANCLNLADA